MISQWPSSASVSEIWDEAARAEARGRMPTAGKLDSRRSRQLIPGGDLAPTGEDVQVPVLLVQQGGVSQQVCAKEFRKHIAAPGLGYGSGWDLIVPKGWGTAFWLPLVYAGGHAGGLRDLRSLSFEMGKPHFPDDFPDTAAYAVASEESRKEREEM